MSGSGEADRSPLAGLGRHTMIYGFGILLSRGVAFLMLPLYTRVLTPADYGVMGLVSMTSDVIAIFAGHSLAQGIFRFYHKSTSEHERDSYVATALMSMAVTFLLAGAAAFVAGDQLSLLIFGHEDYGRLFRIQAGALAFESIVLVPLAYARVRDRSTLFVATSAARLTIQVTLNVVFLVVLDWGVAGILASTLIANATVGSGLAVWALRETGLEYSWAAWRSLFRYGFPLVLTQLATFTSTFADRYFLQSSGGEAVVGVYDLAYKFCFLLVIVGCMPFTQVWAPKRFQIWERPDRDRLLSRGFLYMNLLLVTTAVGISVLVGPMLRVLADPEFHLAAVLVPPLLIAYVLQAWAGVQDIGILVRERTEYLTLAEWTAAGVGLGLYALLIPRYLAWGAVAATVMTFAARFALVYLASQRLAPVRYDWGPIGRLLAVAAAVVIGYLLLPEMGLAMDFAGAGLALAVYFAAVWGIGVLPEEERATLARELRGLCATVSRRVPVAEPRTESPRASHEGGA